MSLRFATLEEALASVDGPVSVTLERNLFGGQLLARITTPGPTLRSKPVDLLGAVIVADAGETRADLLTTIAAAFTRAEEIRRCSATSGRVTDEAAASSCAG